MLNTIIDYKDTKWDNLNLLFNINKLINLFDGETPKAFSKIGNSSINRIFRVDLKYKSIVLKISPYWYTNSLYREKWCYKRIEKLIKVPKVIFYLDSHNKLLPNHEILGLEFINGKQLKKRDFTDLSINERIASIFKAVHNLSVSGYGFLDSGMHGKHNKWVDFLLDIENMNTRQYLKYVSKRDIAWLIDLLSSIETNGKHCLLYGDFKEDNFILKNNSIFAIDFQNCISGVDLYDIGIGVFNIPFILKNINLYIDQISPTVMREVILYSLRHAVTVIINSSASRDVNMLNFSKKRFKELKRIYLRIS